MSQSVRWIRVRLLGLWGGGHQLHRPPTNHCPPLNPLHAAPPTLEFASMLALSAAQCACSLVSSLATPCWVSAFSISTWMTCVGG